MWQSKAGAIWQHCEETVPPVTPGERQLLTGAQETSASTRRTTDSPYLEWGAPSQLHPVETLLWFLKDPCVGFLENYRDLCSRLGPGQGLHCAICHLCTELGRKLPLLNGTPEDALPLRAAWASASAPVVGTHQSSGGICFHLETKGIVPGTHRKVTEIETTC